MSRLMTKPTKWRAPSEDSDQPGHPPSLFRVFAVRTKKAWVLSYPLSAQRRLWSDWADAQADQRLRWAYSHFVGFVMLRLKWTWTQQYLGQKTSSPKGNDRSPEWSNLPQNLMQPSPKNNAATHKIWSRLTIGFRDIQVQKCEIFVTQGQVTPKWVVWFGPKSNSTKLLCLSW